MTYPASIDWGLLMRIAREGRLPISEHTIKKIRAGKQRFTDESCIAIHLATDGGIPCWVTGFDRWQVGQVPPALASLEQDHAPPSLDRAV